MGQEFRVLDSLLITPADGADGNGGASCSLPLTFFDVKWLLLPPVERVLLYRLPAHHQDNTDAVVAALRDSLPRALRAFYPLAGHVRLVPGRTDRHELVYRPGKDGVPFTTAEYDADVDALASDDPVLVSAFSPLVPQLPKGRAVLALQATLLRRGVALGVTIHHTACDGRSSTHFLHTWAAAARGALDAVDLDPPVIDRALVPDPRGLYDTYLKGMPPITRTDGLEFVASKKPPPADVTIATFTLTQEALQGIKSALASEAARRGVSLSPRCSSLVAAFSLMWWCHCHCHASSGTDRPENRSHYYFLLSVDQRARMKPPVPEKYFGNCMCPAIARVARAEMVVDDAASGVYAACAAVVAAIEEEVGEGAQDRWDGCVDRVKEAVAHGTLSVAGSPRFRIYDIDFGFGRPAKVHMVSVAKTGAISVADSRASGRGLELGVSLPRDAMDRFRKRFADAVDSLSK